MSRSSNTSSTTSLKTTLELVGSDKVKERSQGLELLREIFKDDGNCERLAMAASYGNREDGGRGGGAGGGGDRGSWLYVLQAVFGCVGVERAAVIKAMGGGTHTGESATTTTTTAALRTANARLQDAASLTRWLIDRATPYMTKRTVMTAVAHLVQSMIHRGRLLSPLALDYIRALKSLVGDQAHLDHLDEQSWKRLMAVCLDALTGKELSFQHDDWEEEIELLPETESTMGKRPAKRRKIVADDSDEDDNDDEILVEPEQEQESRQRTPKSTQRSKNLSSSTPASTMRAGRSGGGSSTQAGYYSCSNSTNASSLKALTPTTLSPEIIELASIIQIMLGAAQAPILPPPRPCDRPVRNRGDAQSPGRGGCGLAILVRCGEFLTAHRTETSCHRSVVAGVVAVLREVELNFLGEVSVLAQRLFPPLIDLWGTRDEELRDLLLIAYRLLLPFLRQGGPAPGGSHKIGSTGLAALAGLVDNMTKDVGTKRGLTPLDLSLLTLRLNVDGKAVTADNPFSTAVMLAAPDFAPAMATTWLALEVQADSIIELHRHFQSQPTATQSYASTQTVSSTATRGKVRKAGGEKPGTPERDAILSLLENIAIARSEVRSLHLQSLVFLADRHWTYLHAQLQRDVRDELLRLTTDPDPNCQHWSLIALACILARGGHDDQDQFWVTVWQTVSRKTGLSAGSSARAACLLGELMLDRCDKAVTGDAIETVLCDVHVQGPSIPYDSVCSFYAKALSIAAYDARHFRSNYAEGALTWLERSWQASVGQRAKPTTVNHAVNSTPQLCQLVQQISGVKIETAMHAEFPSLCADHKLTKFMQSRLRDQGLRDFLFAAKLPLQTGPVQDPADPALVVKVDPSRIDRLCKLLRKFSEDSSEDSVSMSAAQLRCDLSLAATSVFCQGTLIRACDDDSTPIDREPFSEVCRALAEIVNRALLRNLPPLDLAFVLGGLRPILGVDDLGTLGNRLGIPSTLQAGPLSDVINARSRSLAEQLASIDQPPAALVTNLGLLWENAELTDAYRPLFKAMKRALQGVEVAQQKGRQSDSSDDMQEDDDFGPIRQNDAPMPSITSSEASNGSGANSLASAVARAVLLPRYMQRTRAIRDPEMLNLLLMAEGPAFLSLSPAIAAAVQGGVIELPEEAVDLIITLLDEFLTSHRYRRSIAMRLQAVRWLEAMLPFCLNAESLEAAVMDRMRGAWQELGSMPSSTLCRDSSYRLQILRAMVAYVRHDPHATLWRSQAASASEMDAASATLMLAIDDPDSRIRFLGASAIPLRFANDVEGMRGRARIAVKQEISSRIAADGDVADLATQVLLLVNLCVVASDTRASALRQIYDIVIDCPHLAPHAQRGLEMVADRLHVGSLGELYLCYSPSILPAQVALRDPASISASVYGYRTKAQWATDVAERCGPLLLADEHDQAWSTLTRWAGSSFRGLSVAGQASLWAIRLARAAQDPSEPTTAARLDTVWTELEQEGPRTVTPANLVASLCALIDGELSWRPDGSNSKAEDALSRVESHLGEATRGLKPAASYNSVQAVLDWLARKDPCSAELALYAGVHLYGTLFGNAFIIDERVRLVRSFAFLLARSSAGLRIDALSRAVLRFLVPLLSETDIALAVAAMLEWILSAMRKQQAQLQPSIRDILSAVEIARKLNNQEMSPSILNTLESALEEMLKAQTSRTAVTTLLLLWPAPLSDSLLRKRQSTPLTSLQELVLDDSLSGLKGQLLDAVLASSQARELAPSIFWQLRSELGPQSPGHVYDGYLELAFISEGRVRAPDVRTSARTGDPFRQLTRLADRDGRMATYDIKTSEALLVTKLYEEMSQCSLAQRASIRLALAHIQARNADSTRNPWFKTEARAELELIAGIFGTTASAEPPAVAAGSWLGKFCSDLHRRLGGPWTHVDSVLNGREKLAAKLLPSLVHLCLASATKLHLAATRKEISAELDAALTTQSDDSTLGAIADTVLYLRHFQCPPGDDWLQLDYVSLSRAAIKCRRSASALLFWELSREGKVAQRDVDHELLFSIYSNIDDPDGYYSVPPVGDVRSSLLRRLRHEGDWPTAFRYYGADYESGQDHSANALIDCLEPMGFPHLAILTAQQSAQNAVMPYGLAWKTGTWDLPDHGAKDGDAQVYRSLAQIHNSSQVELADAVTLSNAKTELDQFSQVTGEDLVGGRKIASRLLCLREVRRWTTCVWDLVQREDFDNDDWSEFQTVPKSIDFDEAQLALSVRLSLLQAAKRHAGPQLGQMLDFRAIRIQAAEQECSLLLSSMARENGAVQVAVNALTEAQALLESGPDNQSLQARFTTDFARLLWVQGDHALAIQQLHGVIKARESTTKRQANTASVCHLSADLALLGEWRAEAREADGDTIEVECFQRAIALLPKSHEDQTMELATVYHRYASFADKQQAVMAHAPDIARVRTYRRRKDAEYDSISSRLSSLRANTREAKSLQSELKRVEQERRLDEQLIEEHEGKHAGLVMTAIRMYAKALALTDAHDESVQRLAALWMQHDGYESLNRQVQEDILTVPSDKFIFLEPQLVSRLVKQPNDNTRTFQATLDALMVRLGTDHPFQSLYQLITTAEQSSSAGRESAAKSILDRIKRVPHRTVQVKQMQQFAAAVTEWAWYKKDWDETVKGARTVVKSARIVALRNLDIPPPTADVAVDRSTYYKAVPLLAKYDEQYTLAGGIHRPKIMYGRDQTGRKYKELFKSDDDTRQDAVMEQVFRLINTLLWADQASRKRDLRFRTYKVIPVANLTGIIEFVGEAIGIGSWLTPAHKKYNPNDRTLDSFKAEMRQLQEKRQNQELIRVFKANVGTRIRPVMRIFFTERQQDPMAWFTMRLCYARSLAVSSIAGWVLGLGDRHTSNVMIDRSTGEIVHIDLGIAFDQGRKLHIPELVPFRLTGDMVDGLGWSGVEGVFKRCAQHTFRVLRQSREQVMNVLEVFKHDPLQAWTPTKKGNANEVGDDEDMGASELAERSLATVASKLDGKLSVEYTVNELIREARDPANLAVIFTARAREMPLV